MPTYPDFERDYHAPDREDVLRRMREGENLGQDDWRAPAPVNPTPEPFRGNTGVAGGPSPWQAPTGNREDFKREWMGSGNNVALQNEILKKYGVNLDQAGRGYIPGGDYMDLRIGAKAGINQAGWTATGDPRYGGANLGGGGGAGAGAMGGWGVGGSRSGPVGYGSPQWDELYNMLMGRAKQGLAVDRTNPAVRSQADAYAANEERAKRNALAAMAEKGGPLANLTAETRMANERLGQRTGAFESELVGREISARREEIAQALAGMQGMLTEQQRVALQRELGYLDDAARRYGIDAELSLGRDRLGYDIGRSEMDYYLRSQGL